MRNDKILAYKMRTQGKSYTEIARGLGMSKSTLSSWFRHLDLPQETQNSIREKARATSINALMKINRERTSRAEQRIVKATAMARKQTRKLTKRDLLLLGTTLYWTGGHKRLIVKNGKARTFHAVTYTTSDASKARIFVRFLELVCGVQKERIVADIRFHDLKQSPYTIQYWSKMTGIPLSQFKNVYATKTILPNGTIQIRVNDTALFHTIMGWIEGLGTV